MKICNENLPAHHFMLSLTSIFIVCLRFLNQAHMKQAFRSDQEVRNTLSRQFNSSLLLLFSSYCHKRLLLKIDLVVCFFVLILKS